MNRTAMSSEELLSVQQAMAELNVLQSMLGGLEGDSWWARLPPWEGNILGYAESFARIRVHGVEPVRINKFRPDTDEIEVIEEDLELARAELTKQQQEKEALTVPVNEEILEQANGSIQSFYKHFEERMKPLKPSKGKWQMPSTPRPFRVVLAVTRSEAKLRVTQTAIAVERYRLDQGEAPEHLTDLAPRYIEAEKLIDPFTGDLLLYKQFEDHYTVYSVAYEEYNEKVRMGNPNFLSAISFSVYDKN